MIYDRMKNLKPMELFVLRRDGDLYRFHGRWKDQSGKNHWINEAMNFNTKRIEIFHSNCHVIRGVMVKAYVKAMKQVKDDWIELCKENRGKG